MRIRRKKWAREELDNSKFYIDKPEEFKGKWQEKFDKKQPLHIELGCGKGLFIATLASKHRNINYIAVDMIEAMLSYLDRLKDFYNQVENKNINTSNVVTVMYTAYSKFPDLFKKAKRLYEHELNLWIQAIKNSMHNGEIRGNVPIETTAHMFLHIKDGWDPGRSGVPMNFSIFPEQYNYLYELIKK